MNPENLPEGTKIEAIWADGSSVHGTISDISSPDGGKNLCFGPPQSPWMVLFVVGENNDHFPPGLLPGFAEARLRIHEPSGLGTVIKARLAEVGGPEVRQWVKVGHDVWMPEMHTAEGQWPVNWDAFDYDSVTVVHRGMQ
jgi:hypothetical protein